jgi:hypothetical protein
MMVRRAPIGSPYNAPSMRQFSSPYARTGSPISLIACRSLLRSQCEQAAADALPRRAPVSTRQRTNAITTSVAMARLREVGRRRDEKQCIEAAAGRSLNGQNAELFL